MKCIECEHFRIRQLPLKADGTTWDFGTAECQKYDMVVDFRTDSKLTKLECVNGDRNEWNDQIKECCRNCHYCIPLCWWVPVDDGRKRVKEYGWCCTLSANENITVGYEQRNAMVLDNIDGMCEVYTERKVRDDNNK